MDQLNQLPWLKINDFILEIEKAWEPKEFCTQVMNKFHALIPYDKARTYMLDQNEQLCGEILLGVEKKWSEIYLSYYSKVENSRYSIFTRRNYPNPKIHGSVTDWTHQQLSEFITSYIKPQGIKYSLGFVLYGDNFGKCIFCFDRTTKTGFQENELEIIGVLYPHMQNLLKKAFFTGSYLTGKSNTSSASNPDKKVQLTKRELEIAELLFKGLTPNNISKKLYISPATTYRHIANIHEKLNVSNRQELMLALFKYFQNPYSQTH